MIAQTSTSHERPAAGLPAIRTVALCDIDPAKFAVPPLGMPFSNRTSVLMVFDCANAIHAAMNGDVDMLVIDARRVSVGGLTALSFLAQERPDVSVYFYVETQGAAPRLHPWSVAI
jgi:hypothetical protein